MRSTSPQPVAPTGLVTTTFWTFARTSVTTGRGPHPSLGCHRDNAVAPGPASLTAPHPQFVVAACRPFISPRCCTGPSRRRVTFEYTDLGWPAARWREGLDPRADLRVQPIRGRLVMAPGTVALGPAVGVTVTASRTRAETGHADGPQTNHAWPFVSFDRAGTCRVEAGPGEAVIEEVLFSEPYGDGDGDAVSAADSTVWGGRRNVREPTLEQRDRPPRSRRRPGRLAGVNAVTWSST
jgi:hypothetical protein